MKRIYGLYIMINVLVISLNVHCSDFHIQEGDESIQAEQNSPEIDDVKRTLYDGLKKLVVDTPDLYPTFSSKIHALMKKDDFLSYVIMLDAAGIFDAVCSELTGQLVAAKKILDASQSNPEQKAFEREVDRSLQIFRRDLQKFSSLSLEESLDQQIKFLQNQSGASPAQQTARNALINTLSVQRVVYQGLAQEQKIKAQDEWKKAKGWARMVQ